MNFEIPHSVKKNSNFFLKKQLHRSYDLKDSKIYKLPLELLVKNRLNFPPKI